MWVWVGVCVGGWVCGCVRPCVLISYSPRPLFLVLNEKEILGSYTLVGGHTSRDEGGGGGGGGGRGSLGGRGRDRGCMGGRGRGGGVPDRGRLSASGQRDMATRAHLHFALANTH